MGNYFLKFADEDAFKSVLPEGTTIQPEMRLPDGTLLSILGTLYDYTDPENPVALEGYHVNANELPDGWNSLRVFPNSPIRIFG